MLTEIYHSPTMHFNVSLKHRVLVKISPSWGSDICSKRFGIFSPNFIRLLYVLIYARLQFFIQLTATLMKLCNIKHDHPVHIRRSKCQPSAETHAGWSHLIWHNFVTVWDNWIKISSLAWIRTCNRHVKFGLKILSHLGKNVCVNLSGDFLTHTVDC